ncbi:MAG: peptidyl-alpha-hydroxyglycine alpha-amidating lyase family protein [Chloroflexi bacterium]|nr:peptidyl-alpha-hydroxyglycine alpha-amidating lyase family protein [Chloroflexota bacterium]MDA1145351.1 peptidyl-alpha-hydroxyglycine alpha-amidating lyase family protein [Chloroflexota bacterium]
MVSSATPLTRYEPVIGWPAIPHGMSFREATSVGVAPDGRVYVFNRGQWPVMIFDAGGHFLDSWGAGEFVRPHGIAFDPEGNLYLTDVGLHTVQKRRPDGTLLLEIGEPRVPAPVQSGIPFNQPTQVAVHADSGEIFVSDGYGNSAVHHFSADGKLLKSWGEPEDGPGQFSLPHAICFVGNDKLLVADRENFRLQLFTLEGEFLAQKHMHKPQALFAGRGDDTNIYVAEGRSVPLMEAAKRLGRRVTVLDRELNEVTRFGNDAGGEAPDQFISPHGLAVDAEGSIYVAEVSYTALGSRLPIPQEVVSLRKWQRVDGAATEGGLLDAAIPGYLVGVRTDGPGAAMPIDSPFAR